MADVEEKTHRQRINEELEIIRKKCGGTIRQADVVKYAKRKGSALHAEFDRNGLWDDKTAAEVARLEFASRIIRTYVFVRDDARGPVRALVSLHEDRKKDGPGYRALTDVLDDPDLTESLIQTALMEFRALKRKYDRLAELDGVFAELDRVERRRPKKQTSREESRPSA